MRRTWLLWIAALAIIGIGIPGCSSILAPRPDPTHFFVLAAHDSAPAQTVAQPGKTAVTVGLGPIAFPDYLARAEIVTRSTANRIDVAANDRWAEPLDTAFKRVLAIDLAQALGGAQVVAFPWFGTKPEATYRIEVTIDSFESNAQGLAHLAGRWSIVKAADGATLDASSSAINVPGAAGDRAAMAAALSEAAEHLAQDLAAAVERLRRARSD